jgi:tetratricopeptide (TPR) repeat protein
MSWLLNNVWKFYSCLLLFAFICAPAARADLYQEGVTYFSQGNYAQAESRLQQAINFSPNNANAYYYLAVTEHHLGHGEQMRALLKQILEKFPGTQAATMAAASLGVSAAAGASSSAAPRGAGVYVYTAGAGRVSTTAPVAATISKVAISLDDLVKAARNVGSGPDPRSYFLAQNNDPRWNRDAPGNDANCGPTCLAMVWKRYNVYPPTLNSDTQAQKLILVSRLLVTGQENQALGTIPAQWDQAMRRVGYKTAYISSLSDIDKALDAGALVAVGGCPWVEHSYGPRYHGTGKYPEFHNGHCILVVGKQSGYYIINDPLYFDGPINVGSGELDAFLAWRKAYGIGIAMVP